MKRVLLFLTALSVFALSPLWAQNSISLESATGSQGDTVEIDLVLNNAVAIGGFQLVVKANPAGNVTFLALSAKGRAAGWAASSSAGGDSVAVLVFSSSGASIDPGNEAILTFQYLIGSEAQVGTANLTVSSAKFSDSDLSPVSDMSLNGGTISIQEETSQTYADTINLSNKTLVPGSNVEVGLNLINSIDVSGFQFSLNQSVAGILNLSQIDAVGRAAGWAINYNSAEDGISVIGFSSTGATISAGSGEILNIIFSVSNEAASGQVIQLQMENLKITGADLEPLTGFVVIDGYLSVQSSEASDYYRGDVNRDGSTNIFDLLELLGILGGEKADYK